MSNVTFPSLPGLTWNIEKTPIYNTVKQVPVDFRYEVRTNLMTQQQYSFKLVFQYLRENRAGPGATAPLDFHLSTLEGFYKARNGSFESFLLDLSALTKNSTDSSETGQNFGVGDGTTTVFQLSTTRGGCVEEVYEIKANPNIYLSNWEKPTNWFKFSEDQTNAVYASLTTGNGKAPTITANTTVAPDGNLTADRLDFPAFTNGTSRFGQVATLLQAPITGTNMCFSVWLRADTPCTVNVVLKKDNIAGPSVTQLGGSNGVNPAWNVTTQWQQFFAFGDFGVTASLTPCAGFDTSGIFTSVYTWGWQLEYGSAPSTYSKTTSLAGIGPVLRYSTSRTQLLLQSTNFATTWVAASVTVTANATAAPDGSGTVAQLIAKNTAVANASISQNFVTSDGTNKWTIHVWLKANNSAKADVGIRNVTAGTWDAQTLTILSGPGSVTTGGAAGLNRVQGLTTAQWTHIQVTLNAIPATAKQLAFFIYPDGADSITSGNGVFAYAAQAEVDSTATPYINTTTAQVTVTDYTLQQFLAGTVTFASAPVSGAVISGDFGWYYRVRFDNDNSTTFRNFMYQLWELQELKMLQVRT